MDKEKILQWIQNIEFADAENLSFGSLRTLGDIRIEIKKSALQEKESGAKWISIVDKFPPTQKDVIMYSDNCVTIGCHLPNKTGGSEWWGISGDDIDRPTYWMEKPLPPGEQNG